MSPSLSIFTASNQQEFKQYEKVLDYCCCLMKKFSPMKKHEIFSSAEEYSFFMANGKLKIETDFVLIAQMDGFIINPSAWSDDFLKYDYIGAPWPDGIVGNGGFCLRSKKLLDALKDISKIFSDERYHPEDLYICKTKRNLLETEYGIKFAPFEVANRFSVENRPYMGQFGFHGKYVLNQLFIRNSRRL